MVRHNWRTSANSRGIHCSPQTGHPREDSRNKTGALLAPALLRRCGKGASTVMSMPFFVPMMATRRLIVMRAIVTWRAIMMTVVAMMMAILLPIMAPLIAIAIVAVGRVMVGIGTNHGPRSPADPGANHLAIAPHLVADGRATQGADRTAKRRFILIAMVRRCGAPQGSPDGGSSQCTGLAPHLFPDNSARHPAGGPTNCRIQILSGKCWANQETSNNATCRTKGFDCHDGRLPVVISLIGG